MTECEVVWSIKTDGSWGLWVITPNGDHWQVQWDTEKDDEYNLPKM